MTVVFMGNKSFPTYTGSSFDVIDNSLPECSIVGGTVFLLDTSEWFILDSSLKMQEFVFPFQITLGSTIDIGKVSVDQPLTDSIAISPYYAIQSVSAPGTGVPLMSSATYVVSALIMPKETNASNVYIGTSATDKDTSKQIVLTPTSPGVSIEGGLGYKLDLNQFFVDAITAGEGVKILYLK